MKNIFSIAISCCLFFVSISSCQKESETVDIDPYTGEGILLAKLEMVDSAGIAPQNKDVYAIAYDAQKRMISNQFYFSNFGVMDSTYRVWVTYNGNDTMPNTLLEIDLLLPSGTSFQKHTYKYDLQGRLVMDSLFSINEDLNWRDTATVVTEYSYFANGFRENSRTFNYSQGTGYENELQYSVLKDSRGNITRQEFADSGNNYKIVQEFTYDNHPNPLYPNFLPHYPTISKVITIPLYLGDLQPQPNNFLTSLTTKYNLTTNTVMDTKSQQYSYTYKANGYPLVAKLVNVPAQLFEYTAYNYFYRN
ncbi:MAG: hypothetical protein H7Y86_20450 [Rhizobacter sp.]|nr:hypothetical protein [Ferruginibacter sp.]